MVVEKYSRSLKKPSKGRDRFAYKKSRSVKVCENSKVSNVGSMKMKIALGGTRKLHRSRRSRIRKKQKVCPGAPHNTTSFLINYHKRDSSNDLFGKYGRRSVPDISDRYEVESVLQT
jgi:hypothetical protein